MVSLIVATVNRISELERLLSTLDNQTYTDFEVIVIDQNKDDRLTPVLQKHSGLAIHHLHSERGAARARNVGLRIARGEIICFPDDDCWYPKPLLASVVDWLEQHSEWDALFTIMRDADNRPVGLRWPPQPCTITRSNVWQTTIFVTAFLRRAVTDAVGYFREDIGVGAATPYQSGEESDYFLRALALGFRMRYEPNYTVHHPNLHSLARLQRITYPYALGSGCVMRLHGYSWREFWSYLLPSLGGAVVNLCKGNFAMVKLYLLRAAGLLRGYWQGPRDLAKIAESPSA